MIIGLILLLVMIGLVTERLNPTLAIIIACIAFVLEMMQFFIPRTDNNKWKLTREEKKVLSEYPLLIRPFIYVFRVLFIK